MMSLNRICDTCHEHPAVIELEPDDFLIGVIGPAFRGGWGVARRAAVAEHGGGRLVGCGGAVPGSVLQQVPADRGAVAGVHGDGCCAIAWGQIVSDLRTG